MPSGAEIEHLRKSFPSGWTSFPHPVIIETHQPLVFEGPIRPYSKEAYQLFRLRCFDRGQRRNAGAAQDIVAWFNGEVAAHCAQHGIDLQQPIQRPLRQPLTDAFKRFKAALRPLGYKVKRYGYRPGVVWFPSPIQNG